MQEEGGTSGCTHPVRLTSSFIVDRLLLHDLPCSDSSLKRRKAEYRRDGKKEKGEYHGVPQRENLREE